jgi:hypothetical protein
MTKHRKTLPQQIKDSVKRRIIGSIVVAVVWFLSVAVWIGGFWADNSLLVNIFVLIGSLMLLAWVQALIWITLKAKLTAVMWDEVAVWKKWLQ